MFQIFSVPLELEAGGKPATRFPPEGLVELYQDKIMDVFSNFFVQAKKKIVKYHIFKILQKTVGYSNQTFPIANR